MSAATITRTRYLRIARALSGLAGLAAIIALFAAVAILDPGRTTVQPMSSLSSSSLSASLDLTGSVTVQLTSYAAIAAVLGLVVFSIQLSSRLGRARGAHPSSSSFVVVVGAMLAILLAVEWGLALALGEVALVHDDGRVLMSYFVWGWWQGQLIGVLFLCLMIVVAACGLHGIVLATLARWSTLVLAVAMAISTTQGTAGIGLFAGGAWVAGLSVAMTLDALMTPAVTGGTVAPH